MGIIRAREQLETRSGSLRNNILDTISFSFFFFFFFFFFAYIPFRRPKKMMMMMKIDLYNINMECTNKKREGEDQELSLSLKSCVRDEIEIRLRWIHGTRGVCFCPFRLEDPFRLDNF